MPAELDAEGNESKRTLNVDRATRNTFSRRQPGVSQMQNLFVMQIIERHLSSIIFSILKLHLSKKLKTAKLHNDWTIVKSASCANHQLNVHRNGRSASLTVPFCRYMNDKPIRVQLTISDHQQISSKRLHSQTSRSSHARGSTRHSFRCTCSGHSSFQLVLSSTLSRHGLSFSC